MLKMQFYVIHINHRWYSLSFRAEGCADYGYQQHVIYLWIRAYIADPRFSPLPIRLWFPSFSPTYWQITGKALKSYYQFRLIIV